MKTSGLTGNALDWAVAKALGCFCTISNSALIYTFTSCGNPVEFNPSINWAYGGPIIERERIHIRPNQSDTAFKAFVIIRPHGLAHRHDGPTPLIASMRCFVASKLGDEIELPKGLE